MRRNLAVLLIILAGCISLMAIDAADLFARHQRAFATSPEALSSFSSLQLKGVVEKYGFRGEVTIASTLPDRFGFSIQLPLFQERWALRGQAGEVRDLTGWRRALEGAEMEEAKALQYILGGLYIKGALALQEIKEDPDTISAIMRSESGLMFEVHFDAKTSLLKRFSFRAADGNRREFQIEAFQDVEGLRIPSRLKETGLNPANYEFSTVQVNRGIDSNLFSIPEEPARFSIPEKSIVRIPFQMYFDLPFIKAWIGNSPALTFLVDTSLPFSVLDKTIATQLGFTTQGLAFRSVRYPISEFSFITAPSVLLREIEFKDQVFLVTNMMPPSANIQMPVHGILGADFFRQSLLQIDFKEDVIRFLHPKAFSPDPKLQKLNLSYAGGVYSVAGRLDGYDVQMELATSLGETALFSDASLMARNLLRRYPNTAEALSLGLLFGQPERIVKVESMALEGLTFQGPLIHLNQFPDDSPFARKESGWLGTEILRRYILTMDLPARTLYLEPNPNGVATGLYNNSGLYIIRSKGNCVVQQVIKDSPADKAGIQPWDILIQIHEYPCNQVVFDRLYGFLKLDKGQQLPLVLQRGEEQISVTLSYQSAF